MWKHERWPQNRNLAPVYGLVTVVGSGMTMMTVKMVAVMTMM